MCRSAGQSPTATSFSVSPRPLSGQRLIFAPVTPLLEASFSPSKPRGSQLWSYRDFVPYW